MAVVAIVGGQSAIGLTTSSRNPFIGVVLPAGAGGPTTGNLYIAKQQGVSAASYDLIIGVNGQFSYPADENPYTLWFATDPGAIVYLYYNTDGSTVDLGTLADGSKVLAQSSNAPELLYSSTTGIPNGTPGIRNIYSPLNNVPAGALPLDVSQFASIIVRIAINPQAVVPTNGLQVNNWLTAQIVQYDPNTPGSGYTEEAQWLYDMTNIDVGLNPSPIDATGIFEFAVPVREQTANINVVSTIDGTLNHATYFHLSIYGSYETLEQPRYINQSSLLIAGKVSGEIAAIAASALGTTNAWIESTTDDGNFTLTKLNALAMSAVASMSYATNGGLYEGGLPIASLEYPTTGVNGNELSVPVNPPPRPLQLTLTNGGVTGSTITTFNQ